MNTTKVKMPKAAQQLIDDAKASPLGFTVKVRHDDFGVTVDLEREDGKISGSAVWGTKVVYDTPLSHERLGFRTTEGKKAVRFIYGSSHNAYRGYRNGQGPYGSHNSVRQMRLAVGLGD